MPAPLVAFNLEPDFYKQPDRPEGAGPDRPEGAGPVVPAYRPGSEGIGVIDRSNQAVGVQEPLGGITRVAEEHGVNCKKDCCKIFNTYNAVRVPPDLEPFIPISHVQRTTLP